MAGDVSGEPPYVGRGGWSWYTGSAAWMHRAAIEHLFGVRQHGDRLSISPCLPSHWPQAEIFLQRAGRTLRIVVCRHDTVPTSAGAPAPQGPELAPGATLNWQELPQQSYRLLRLPAAASADATGVASALTAPT
jgi:cyclic beta-1,2-glucan synthetase